MIDIHHHLLWGVDDGAADLETSLDMARMAAADGITHIACTPHANSEYEYVPAAIDEKITELQRLVHAEGLELKLGRGCDFHLSYDNLQEAKTDPARFSINGLGYLLVEIPDYGLSPGLTDVFYQLQLDGLTPILTHPERNATLQSDASRLKDWLRGGVLIQITAASILGHMGKKAERLSHDLLAKRWVHFVATDAHNIRSRPPRLLEAFDTVANKYGSEYAHLLFVSNPLAAFLGKALPSQPEPLGIYDDMKPKSWWQRLVSR
jgi:protein-tyrosine phosphatase